MRYRFYTTDVFTDRVFGGNPLAVFPDANGLAPATMQRIAAEFGVSETVFVLPPEHHGHTRRLRIFTPGTELPFAGHPTVGTAYVLARTGHVALRGEATRVVFEEAVGPVPVSILWRQGSVAGATLRAVGRHQDALPHLSAALTLLEALPPDTGSAVEWQRARIQINLGRALETLERYPEAIRHYRGALPLYEKLEGPNSMMAAALHVNIAVLSGKLGDKAAADTHWNAALSGALAAIRDKVLAILPDSVGKLIDRLTQGRADETGGEPTGDADKARGGKGG